jgi:steroid delta-isomerase-like uncharacterized protein
MERVAGQETAYRLVADYIAACNAHDVDRVTSLFTEDGSYGEFGQGNILLRREDIRRYLTAKFPALPGLTITLTAHPVYNGEQALFKWVMTGTPRGEFAGVPPTGNSFRVQGMTVLILRGDRIAGAIDSYDVRIVARQLRYGLAPDPEAGALYPSFAAADVIASPGFPDSEDNIRYGE